MLAGPSFGGLHVQIMAYDAFQDPLRRLNLRCDAAESHKTSAAKRAIKIRNRTGQWTAEGLLGELGKAAYVILAGPTSLGSSGMITNRRHAELPQARRHFRWY